MLGWFSTRVFQCGCSQWSSVQFKFMSTDSVNKCTLVICRLSSKVKVVGQSSQSLDGNCFFSDMDVRCNVMCF